MGGGGQAHGVDGVAERQRLAELQQGDVVVVAHGVVVRVADDGLQAPPLHPGLLGLVLHAAVGLPAGRHVVPEGEGGEEG